MAQIFCVCPEYFIGAQRKFSFKHKVSNELVPLELKHGSLLVMKGTTQTHWLHRLPTTKKVEQIRINTNKSYLSNHSLTCFINTNCAKYKSTQILFCSFFAMLLRAYF